MVQTWQMMRQIKIKKKSINFKPGMTAKETHVRGTTKTENKGGLPALLS